MSIADDVATLRDSADWEARRDAAKSLGDAKEPVALDALAQALRHDPHKVVRWMAAKSLGKLGLPQAAPLLLEAIGPTGDEDFVVEDAARALGALRLPETVEPMLTELRRRMGTYREGQDYSVIHGIADGLGKIGVAAVPALVDCLNRREMVNEMLEALEPIGDPRAESALLAAAFDGSIHPGVRRKAVAALGNIAGADCRVQLGELAEQTTDSGLLTVVVATINKMGGPVEGADTQAATRRGAEQLLAGLRAIHPGMREDEADRLVGSAVFGLGANQVHNTPYGQFQLIVDPAGIVRDATGVNAVISAIEAFLNSAAPAAVTPRTSIQAPAATSPAAPPPDARSGIRGWFGKRRGN